MPRFILRARTGKRDQLDVSLREHPEVQIIDETSSRMLLVEGTDDILRIIGQENPGWVVALEETIPAPKIRVSPK